MLQKNFLNVSDDKIYLRPLTAEDATPGYCAWLNDPEVTKYLEVKSCTMEELKAYIKRHVDSPNSMFLGIFDKINGKHIGNIKLEPINHKSGTAVLGIVIGDKEYWGKGVGTEAVKLCVRWVFESLGLNELTLGFIAGHVAAERSYERAGFAYLRTNKHKVWNEGAWHDEIEMVIRKDGVDK